MVDLVVFLSSILLFSFIYCISFYYIYSGWTGRRRFEASSCAISFVHGLVTLIFAGREVVTLYPWKLDAPNTPTQERIMQFSLAYFVVDMVHLVLGTPDDVLYVLHHIMTSSYMISCWVYARHGAISVMMLIAAGEATSPCLNVWTVARLGRADSRNSAWLYSAMSPYFTVYFTLVRAGLGPWLVWKLGMFYLPGSADAVIPRWLAAMWVALTVGAVGGSMVWVNQLWKGLIKFYSKKKTEKTT